MTELAEKLRTIHACNPAVEWADNRQPYAAWRSCQRGDWLLWLAVAIGVDRKLVTLAACDCAEQALAHAPVGTKPMAQKCLETARAWCRGEVALEEVRAARTSAAYAAYYAAYATAAAATAASAAYANDLAAAAYAASAAAYAASAAVAAAESRSESLARSAVMVRKRIPWRVVRDAAKKNGLL